MVLMQWYFVIPYMNRSCILFEDLKGGSLIH